MDKKLNYITLNIYHNSIKEDTTMTITVHTPINTKPLTENLSEALAEVIFQLYNTELINIGKKEERTDEDRDL